MGGRLAKIRPFEVSPKAFVLLYEEPYLRRKFGPAYLSYCETVNRWLPKKPPQ